MSVDIAMDEGVHVRGDAITAQGVYYVSPHSATINETVTTADASLPRLDQVILEIQDNVHDGTTGNLARTRVVAGTPTSGATLDNRNGAAALPGSALLLADVIVAAGAGSITNAAIRDRRAFQPGAIPPLLTVVDAVPMIPPLPPLLWDTSVQSGSMNSAWDLQQAAALMYLPRRIAAATRVRWRYAHSTAGGALTGNYVIGIYDSSGRKVVDTGTVALTGAAGSLQIRSETIAATTFEPGCYYVLIGFDTTSGANTRITYQGVITNTNELVQAASAPNLILRSASGGVAAPTTLLGMTDVNSDTSQLAHPVVPLVALSVG